MTPLRAFLMTHLAGGHWAFSVFRDLESLEDAWLSRSPGSAGVLHIGFSRPNEQDFEGLIEAHPDRLLLTEGARFALPATHSESIALLGSVNEQRVYLVVEGWGYTDNRVAEGFVPDGSLGDPPTTISTSHYFTNEYLARQDWLAAIESLDLRQQAAAAGVTNEATYVWLESSLPEVLKEALGWERYIYYAGLIPCADSLIRNLRLAPPWLLETEIGALNLSVRSYNGLRAQGIEKVADILALGRPGVTGIDNIGRKSALEIEEALVVLFASGPWRSRTEESRRISQARLDCVGHSRSGYRSPKLNLDKIKAPSPPAQTRSVSGLMEAIDAALSLLPERTRKILASRMGMSGERLTLEQIGRTFKMTRERVRQIEQRASNKISPMAVWRELSERIDACLCDRTDPIPIQGLEILDSWFAGVDRSVTQFKYVLNRFCGGRHSLLKIDGKTFVSALSQTHWDRCVRQGEEIVNGFIGRGVSEQAVRMAIDGLLLTSGQELRSALWEKVTVHAHFSGPNRILISVGAGVQHAVEAVLAESQIPLHYSEIAKRCIARLGRPVDVRRAQSAAASVGFLYGRGVYGLMSHLPFDSDEIQEIRDEAEDVILEEPHRQWHASEVVLALQDRGLDFDGKLNSYVLSIVLRASDKLVGLGRSVWTSSSTGAQGTSDRIDVAQAIHAVLIEAGRPLSASEIRARVSLMRGVSSHFQVHPGDGVIRVSQGKWGLVGRDVDVQEETISIIKTALTSELERLKKGLHISEILSVVEERAGSYERRLSPEAVFDMVTRDGEIRAARGQFLYLESWEGPRRLTISQAAKVLLEGAERGVRSSDLEERIRNLLGRDVSRQSIVAVLSDVGAYFSEETGTWQLANESEMDEEAAA